MFKSCPIVNQLSPNVDPWIVIALQICDPAIEWTRIEQRIGSIRKRTSFGSEKRCETEALEDRPPKSRNTRLLPYQLKAAIPSRLCAIPRVLIGLDERSSGPAFPGDLSRTR